MLETTLIGQLESRLTGLSLPVSVTLWNGRTIGASEPAVKLTVRSPKAILSLANPSLGRIAKAYVEGEIDLDGTAEAAETEPGRRDAIDDALRLAAQRRAVTDVVAEEVAAGDMGNAKPLGEQARLRALARARRPDQHPHPQRMKPS